MAGDGKKSASATKDSKRQRRFNGSAKQKKNRAMRNAARRKAIKKGTVRKGDGKDIDHKRKIKDGGTNSKGNTRVRSRSSNRADNGGTGGRKKKRTTRKR